MNLNAFDREPPRVVTPLSILEGECANRKALIGELREELDRRGKYDEEQRERIARLEGECGLLERAMRNLA